MKISYFDDVRAKNPKYIELQEWIDMTINPDARVLRVRAAAGTPSYKTLKESTLPMARYQMMAGSSNESLLTFNGLIYIDVDAKDIERALTTKENIKSALSQAKCCVWAAYSVSGQGVSALFTVDPAASEDWLTDYPKVYSIIAADLAHGNIFIDKQACNVGRGHFLTHDPNPYLKYGDPSVVPIKAEFLKTRIEELDFSTSNRKLTKATIEDIEKIVEYLIENKKSITAEHNEWMRVGCALINTFEPDEARRLFHALSQLDGDKYDAGKVDKKFNNLLKTNQGAITIGTVFYLAAKQGYERVLKVYDFDKNALPPADVPEEEIEKLICEMTEKGDGDLFCLFYGHRFFYHKEDNDWYVYEEGYWSIDKMNKRRSSFLYLAQVYKRACGRKHAEIAKNENAASWKHKTPSQMTGPEKEEKKELEKQKHIAGGMTKHIIKINTVRWIASCLEFASDVLGKQIKDLNANPYLFNLKNYTLNLEKEEAQLHNYEDYITFMGGIEFEKELHCPEWTDFLNKIFKGQNDIISFVQRQFGAAMFGKNSFQQFLFMFGSGANGKSTFLETIRRVFGTYAGKIQSEMLMQQKGGIDNNINFEISTWAGKRILFGSEIAKGAKLNESLIKDLTGGDVMKYRKPGCVPNEFKNYALIVLAGNHKPKISGTDEGIWRRCATIPFDYKIPENERRPFEEVVSGFIEKEGAAIAVWLYRGYRASLKNNEVPESVKAATKEYREDEDFLLPFISECIEKTENQDDKRVMNLLYLSYKKYAEINGDAFVISINKFTREMKDRGFVVKTGHGNKKYVHFIKVTEPQEQHESQYALPDFSGQHISAIQQKAPF